MTCISFCGKEYYTESDHLNNFGNDDSNIGFYIYSNYVEVIYNRFAIAKIFHDKGIINKGISLDKDVEIKILRELSSYAYRKNEVELCNEFENYFILL